MGRSKVVVQGQDDSIAAADPSQGALNCYTMAYRGEVRQKLLAGAVSQGTHPLEISACTAQVGLHRAGEQRGGVGKSLL